MVASITYCTSAVRPYLTNWYSSASLRFNAKPGHYVCAHCSWIRVSIQALDEHSAYTKQQTTTSNGYINILYNILNKLFYIIFLSYFNCAVWTCVWWLSWQETGCMFGCDCKSDGYMPLPPSYPFRVHNVLIRIWGVW